MAEVLVAFASIYNLSDSDLRKASAELHDVVRQNKQMLVARHLYGVMARHDVSAEHSYKKLQKHAQEGDRTLPTAFIHTEAGVVGMANAIDLSLRKQANGLPPKVSKALEGLLGKIDPVTAERKAKLPGRVSYEEQQQAAEVANRGPNVAAYSSDPSVLEDAYDYLRQACRWRNPMSEPWTIEPFVDDAQSEAGKAQIAAHEAIMGAGFIALDSGRYEEQESNEHWVNEMRLYVASAHEAQMVHPIQ